MSAAAFAAGPEAVVGAWPASEDRLLAYMEKASREADDLTHWTAPDEAFEGNLAELVRNVLAAPASGDVEAFLAETEQGRDVVADQPVPGARGHHQVRRCSGSSR